MSEAAAPAISSDVGRPAARAYWAGGVLLLGLTGLILCRTAWLCDDSYITFRTIDNFVHGYGLRWNIDERVQAYTHPLWLLMMTVGRLITGEVYWTALLLSLACSLGALWLLARALRGRTAVLLLGIAVLLSSRAFVDYSSSGLENALSHLLIAGFLLTYWSEVGTRRSVRLGAWAGLVLLNRLDLAVLVAPPLLMEWTSERRNRWALLFWLAAPMGAWVIFSLLYYGFPFPNTAYAKLHTGISERELIPQGLYYFKNSLVHDPSTLVAIGAAAVVTILRRRPRDVAVLGGIVLYLGYVVWIGGDFMSGRFFAAPLVVAVWLITVPIDSAPMWTPALGSAALLAISFAGPYTAPIISGQGYGRGDQLFDSSLEDRGINDERRFYFQQTGMLRPDRRHGLPIDHPWAAAGRQAGLTGAGIVIRGNVGFFGYEAGPTVHIIDYYALTDPLLARLPAKQKWRIGHFVRIMPLGYPDTIQAGINQIPDPDLAAYYDHLHLITSGPLWSVARLRMIVRVNLGRDEDLLARYVARLKAAGYE